MPVASNAGVHPSEQRRHPRSKSASPGDVELREQTLLALARRDATDFEATCRAVTEAATVLVGVARASVWRFSGDALVCDDLFLRDEARHAAGQAIRTESSPSYFAAVAQSTSVSVADAHTDARTRELDEWYLKPLGIGAMLDMPIWQGGAARGVVCCEHVGGRRAWTAREERDAARMADLVARSIEASARRSAEERSRIVLDAIPQYIVVVDENGALIDASAAARRALAEEGGTSLAERFEDLEMRDLSGELLAPSELPVERARRGETVVGEIVQVTSRVTGQSRWLRATSAPLGTGPDGRGAVVIYEDVAEEIRIERFKRDLLSTVAHEMRTPTTIARGYAQRLLKMPGRPVDEMRALSAIERATARIGRLAEDLVDLSAITLGRIVLSMQQVTLAAVALRAVELAHASRTHVVRFVPSPAPARVFIDPLRMQRVVGELLENAARWSSSGSEIDVEIRVRAGFAELLVRDRGVAIPEAAQPRIFEPFFRAHAGTPSDASGLGIGLFLAREVVVRQGGTLTFESKEGSGTTFTVRLPLDEEQP
jgi:signal transduction histidine kinase